MRGWISEIDEEFFRRLAARLGHAMLLRKGELHRLVEFADPAAVPEESRENSICWRLSSPVRIPERNHDWLASKSEHGCVGPLVAGPHFWYFVIPS